MCSQGKNPSGLSALGCALAGAGCYLLYRKFRGLGEGGDYALSIPAPLVPSEAPASQVRAMATRQQPRAVRASAVRAYAVIQAPAAATYVPGGTPPTKTLVKPTVTKKDYKIYEPGQFDITGVPSVASVNAETERKLAQAQQVLSASRAMDQLKAGYATAGRIPPGSIAVPITSASSEALAQQWASYAQQAPPRISMMTGALDMLVGQFGFVSALGSEKASDLAIVGVLSALTEQIAKFGRQPTKEEVDRITAISNIAGFNSGKVFSGGLARGEFTTADITDAALDAQGYGARRIGSYMENAMTGILAPKISGFLAESQLTALGGGQLSKSEIKSVASGVERDVQKAIAEVARTDKNFSGRKGYIESVAIESAFGQLRSIIAQKSAPQIAEKLSGAIGAYIPKQALNAISAAAGADVGIAFAQSQGLIKEDQLTQIGTQSVAKNILPYVPGIGEQIARSKIDSILGDVTKLTKLAGRNIVVLTEDQKELACKQIGKDLGQWASEKIAADDYASLNEENLKSVGIEIAKRRLGPIAARAAVDIAAGEFGKKEEVKVAMDKAQKAIDIIRQGYPEIDDNPKVFRALELLSSVLKGRTE